jgi:hypothetical protein
MDPTTHAPVARTRCDSEPTIAQAAAACVADPHVFLSHLPEYAEDPCGPLVGHALGRNPACRVVVITRTAEDCAGVFAAVKDFLEENTTLRHVFPGFRAPHRDGAPFTLCMDTSHHRDPSVRVVPFNYALVGTRIDVVVCVGFVPESLEGVPRRWLDLDVRSRCTEGHRVLACGTAAQRLPRAATKALATAP